MRIILLFLLSGILCLNSYSQIPQQSQRRVNFRSIGLDSINLHLDQNYFLIEDTCSSIVRYAHFNFQTRQFFGSFRDLNKQDPMIILSEGRYSDEGELDGAFTLRYLNGTVQATGSFINGVMNGAWELFFEDGKPWMSFKAKDNKIQIDNAWDNSGKKLVESGIGIFRSDLNDIYWSGKLLNGYPDGTWKAKKTDDRTNTVLSSEIFKNGLFVKGSGPLGAYSDGSRIELVSPTILPVNNAALMQVSSASCDPSLSRKKIINAIYYDGIPAFTEKITEIIGTFLGKSNFESFYLSGTDIVIEGHINEKGSIVALRSQGGLNDRITSGLIKELQRLPQLEPALVNGQAVKQGITFSFKFSLGTYSFSYQFLPVKG
ncbi:MAG: hypothetical protein H7Y07_11560 [Pyrinomonadaceae bacterium]|nr:hypothetical protein [Sphingobacteriaceae bacterium]